MFQRNSSCLWTTAETSNLRKNPTTPTLEKYLRNFLTVVGMNMILCMTGISWIADEERVPQDTKVMSGMKMRRGCHHRMTPNNRQVDFAQSFNKANQCHLSTKWQINSSLKCKQLKSNHKPNTHLNSKTDQADSTNKSRTRKKTLMMIIIEDNFLRINKY